MSSFTISSSVVKINGIGSYTGGMYTRKFQPFEGFSICLIDINITTYNLGNSHYFYISAKYFLTSHFHVIQVFAGIVVGVRSYFQNVFTDELTKSKMRGFPPSHSNSKTWKRQLLSPKMLFTLGFLSESSSSIFS